VGRAHALAIDKAGVGYQDIAGLINGEREATERLNESIQRNTQYRAAQQTAIQQANETQFRSAITATGQGGGLPQYMPAGGGTGTGFNSSPFANPAFASWYAANYGERETFINEHAGSNQAEAMATVRPMEVILEQFRNRFMQSFEEVTDHERTKITEALSHAGETFAQRETRVTGVPSVQGVLDDSVTRVARQAVTAIESTMSLAARASVEYTATMQGPTAALGSLGRAIDTSLTEQAALAKATAGFADATNSAATEMQQAIRTAWDVAYAATGGADLMGALGKRVYAAALAETKDAEQSAALAAAAVSTMENLNRQGALLQQGAMALTQSLTIAKGLTYGEIYGNTVTNTGNAGGSNQGVVNLTPGNYYGLPVTGPLTGGTLRGYATGGPIDRPTILVDQASMRPYARAGEAGPEWVGPRGGGVALSVNVTVNGADALRDTRLWEQLADRQIVPVLRKRGLVT
jgi:hypothetical protein